MRIEGVRIRPTERWGDNGTFAWRGLPESHPVGCGCRECIDRAVAEMDDGEPGALFLGICWAVVIPVALGAVAYGVLALLGWW